MCNLLFSDLRRCEEDFMKMLKNLINQLHKLIIFGEIILNLTLEKSCFDMI